MTDPANAIARTLTHAQTRALRIVIGYAGHQVGRMRSIPGLGRTSIDWLIANGLAETPTFNTCTGEKGIRATDLARRVVEALESRPRPPRQRRSRIEQQPTRPNREKGAIDEQER